MHSNSSWQYAWVFALAVLSSLNAFALWQVREEQLSGEDERMELEAIAGAVRETQQRVDTVCNRAPERPSASIDRPAGAEATPSITSQPLIPDGFPLRGTVRSAPRSPLDLYRRFDQ
ncbi:MAG: hypothetical protein AB7P00_20340 [Sandaracinaceae bacterium]